MRSHLGGNFMKHLISISVSISDEFIKNLNTPCEYITIWLVLARAMKRRVSILPGESGEKLLKKACPSLDLVRKHYQVNRRTSQCLSSIAQRKKPTKTRG